MELFIILLILFIHAYIYTEDAKEVEGITILTDEIFQKFIETHDKVLVKFFAPWFVIFRNTLILKYILYYT